MGLSASSVIPLLSKWEEYLSTNPEGDIAGFARWVLAATLASDPTQPQLQAQSQPPTQPQLQTQSQLPTQSQPLIAATASSPSTSAPGSGAVIKIPFLITHLYRDLQQRSKPIAKQLGLTNSMELDMLVHIAALKDPNKKQVSQEMLIESSTGVEIAKRLVAKGFLREQPDAKDRRAARLSLTVKGKETVLQGYKELEAVHSDLLSTLRYQLPPLS